MGSHSKQDILNFIQKRFPIDCNWTNGNCYYFAIILKTRFPSGEIVYDVIDGHFLFRHNNVLYDYRGEQSEEGRTIISWKHFNQYDKNQKRVIIRDCIL